MRFTLVVQPDGHALVTTRERLDEPATKALASALRQWRNTPHGVGILPECEVVQVVDITLDVETGRLATAESGG